jgi:hypothetical protein
MRNAIHYPGIHRVVRPSDNDLCDEERYEARRDAQREFDRAISQ